MPEALILPGIDPAPAAPAAPEPSQAPGDDHTQSASVDTGAPPPTGEPTPDEGQPQSSPKGVQKRIGELVERERTANARADRMEALVEKVVSGIISPQQARAQVGAPQQGEDPRPLEKDFTSWQEHNAAVMRWEARREVAEQFKKATEAANQQEDARKQEHQVRARAEAEQQLHDLVSTQMHEAGARIPGFEEAIMNAHFDVPLNLEAAMAVSGAAGEVALYLSHHPHLVPRLAKLHDMALGVQINRIATAMRSGSLTVSNAPPPGRPSGSRGSGPSDYPKDATPQQHLEWEARQKRTAGVARK